MATGSGGALPSAGTRDTKVQRISEGIPGLATVENPTANPPTFQTLDVPIAGVGAENAGQVSQISTDETSRLDVSSNVKRGKPSAWGGVNSEVVT